jgi:hypothetical protein
MSEENKEHQVFLQVQKQWKFVDVEQSSKCTSLGFDFLDNQKIIDSMNIHIINEPNEPLDLNLETIILP